jgi:hypothetical protein
LVGSSERLRRVRGLASAMSAQNAANNALIAAVLNG